MNLKIKYILVCLVAIIIIICIVFLRGEKINDKTQEDNISDNADIAIPITSSKKENEIIIESDEEVVVIESGEEIVVGE